MPKFIRLTMHTGEVQLINADHIMNILPAKNDLTFIGINSLQSGQMVKESVDEILAMIDGNGSAPIPVSRWQDCDWSIAEAVRLSNGEVIPIRQCGSRSAVEFGESKIMDSEFDLFGLKPVWMVPA